MVKVGKCALIGLLHKKWTLRVELTKKNRVEHSKVYFVTEKNEGPF